MVIQCFNFQFLFLFLGFGGLSDMAGLSMSSLGLGIDGVGGGAETGGSMSGLAGLGGYGVLGSLAGYGTTGITGFGHDYLSGNKLFSFLFLSFVFV